MKRKTRLDPIWVMGNSALAETINPNLSPGLVSYLHDVMGWDLTSEYNDALWEGLEDVNAYHKE